MEATSTPQDNTDNSKNSDSSESPDSTDSSDSPEANSSSTVQAKAQPGVNSSPSVQAKAQPEAGTTSKKSWKMRLWRGDASGGKFQEYESPIQEGEVLLDVVHAIQASQANDIAVRWNCKAGKCGSCSAEINGRPSLMCMTRMETFDPETPITVAPMKTFPIIKDLVTDVSFNYEVAQRVPSLKIADPGPDGVRRMYQQDVDRIQEYRKCIECFLCQDVCHVIRDHEDNKKYFAGPRFFLRYAEMSMHPLNTQDVRDIARSEGGIGFCNITKCCTEVCPESIKITDNAIIPMKERVVDRHFDPIAWLGRKITRKSYSQLPK